MLGFGKSGGYRVLSNLANEWVKNGFGVHFLVPEKTSYPYFPTLAEIIWVNKKGERVNKKSQTVQGNFLCIQKSLLYGLKKNNASKYDIILVNQSLTAYPVYFAGLKKSAVYYVQAFEPEHYQFAGGIKNNILRIFSLLSYKMGFYTIVNSDIYKRYGFWLKSNSVVPPGIDLKIFYKKENHSRDNNKIIIGTIARKEKNKGTAYVIEAFTKLKSKYSNLELHAAFGNAEDWGNLEDVRYCTPKSDQELADYYRSLDIYICAGIIQFGSIHYPVLESMACGTTLVTTLYYPANNENCYIIEPQSVDSIVIAVEEILKNPEIANLKCAKANKDIYQFEWNIVANKMIDFFKEKLSKK